MGSIVAADKVAAQEFAASMSSGPTPAPTQAPGEIALGSGSVLLPGLLFLCASLLLLVL
eukprot:JP444162.1.p4 GENE.JP444162.1~~JP444162.1.p4  ORF type:complete len:59 (+),score=15.26 JP444162.1:1-177(+)